MLREGMSLPFQGQIPKHGDVLNHTFKLDGISCKSENQKLIHPKNFFLKKKNVFRIVPKSTHLSMHYLIL